MAFAAKIIVLRKDNPIIGKFIGDVIDIIPMNNFEGKEVEKQGQSYIRIYCSNLSQELADELKSGEKSFIPPSNDDPYYSELLTGKIEVNEYQLLPYLEGK